MFVRIAVLIALLVLLQAAAWADTRVALVIGNGAYMNAPTLENPTNDAAAMTNLLRKARFSIVESKFNLGVAEMRRALRDFSDNLRDADIAVVFYAGHGMEMNGVNYLIPVDARLARDIDVEDEAISLDRLIRLLEPVRKLQLILLDSCRDNPFVRSMRRTVASRSLLSGHGDIDDKNLAPNMLIGYAQKAGATAEDGTTGNSPYTTSLLKHPATPGLDIELALRRVRDEVLKATRNRQEPFKYGSLGGAELPLAPITVTDTAEQFPTPPDATREWSGVDKTSIPELETFIERHSKNPEAAYARARLKELQKSAAAVSPSPSKPLLPNVIDKALGIVQLSRPPTLWYHNGSTAYLTVNGSGREFHYDKPRPEMIQAGAKQGTLLFTGVSSSNTYEGTAYIFRGACGQFPYHVSGPILDDGRRVALQGQAPRVNERCQIVGYINDHLEFTLIPSAP